MPSEPSDSLWRSVYKDVIGLFLSGMAIGVVLVTIITLVMHGQSGSSPLYWLFLVALAVQAYTGYRRIEKKIDTD